MLDVKMVEREHGDWVRHDEVASIIAGYEQRMRLINWWSQAHGAVSTEDFAVDPVAEATTEGPTRDKSVAEGVAPRPAEPPDLREALRVILKAARGDEKGECWTIRKWLDKRDIYNDDISGNVRLIEEVCKAALKEPPAPRPAVSLPDKTKK